VKVDYLRNCSTTIEKYKKYPSRQSKQTSEPILKRNAGSASIRLRSIEHDLMANPKGQKDPCNLNITKQQN
jgi:hypothetical protein